MFPNVTGLFFKLCLFSEKVVNRYNVWAETIVVSDLGQAMIFLSRKYKIRLWFPRLG